MSKQTKYDKISLLGVEVDALTIKQAIDYITERAADHSQPAGYVVKPYVEFMDRIERDESLRDILNQAELCLPDGVALIWAAAYLYAGKRSGIRFWRTLGQIVTQPDALKWPLPERIAGINFTWPLLEAAQRQHISVFLIGQNHPKDIEAVAATIRKQLPKLDIAGTFYGRDFSRPSGEVSEAWIQDALTAIRRSRPDIVLVGMGFPLQERVMARLAPQLDHGLLIGEGGTFDYEQFGGRLQKAPGVMQRLGLEWLWRLILEPKRIGRQLAIPRFITRIWRTR